MIIEDNEIVFDIELGKAQSHKNMAIIPLKGKLSYKLDILTLKKGLELGLANVKECENSTVNTVIVENSAVTPLILIDGEEILGANQNRIVNSTILVKAKSAQPIPVSCTEQGRWAYKSEFKQSEYIANYNTRRAKEVASRMGGDYQSEIWNSISKLEDENSFKSATCAMSESYENLKADHDEFLKEFKMVDGQSGIVIMQNGEIKGFEIFYNPQIYAEYHEKILRSYLIDNKVENTLFTINMDEIESIISDAKKSSFEKRKSEGLEAKFEFENDYGLGTLYTFDEEIIHWSYFKKEEKIPDEDIADSEKINETA